DVLVTDQGIAVNPNRPEVKERLLKAGLKVTTIEALKESAEKVVGKPDPLQFTDKVVAVVTHPDGRVLDVIHEVKA
ncbi:MAG: citF, partial [Firmicutes bacterium]|nr:citF [Bacillota bacterium]